MYLTEETKKRLSSKNAKNNNKKQLMQYVYVLFAYTQTNYYLTVKVYIVQYNK